jgi:hypothetical protein
MSIAGIRDDFPIKCLLFIIIIAVISASCAVKYRDSNEESRMNVDTILDTRFAIFFHSFLFQ